MLYLPLPSAASAGWTFLLHWVPPGPLVYPSQYQTPGFYICTAITNINICESEKCIYCQVKEAFCPCCIFITHRVVAVLEAHILNHDYRRRNLPTGRKIKWQSLWETEADSNIINVKPVSPKCVSLGLKTTESYLNDHFNHITVPCHSQLFQSSRMPPSSAASSLCSAPVVQALRSRDQTWQCNSTGEGRK